MNVYSPTATQAAFPIGGIGTGTISLGSRGNLQDWEIFNRPDKGNHVPDSFFSLRAQWERGEPVVRVLEAELVPPFSFMSTRDVSSVMGLPRFATSEMSVERPFAQVRLFDDELPLAVTLEAFTPFIPLDADDSGIPVMILRYNVTNTNSLPADITIAGTLVNLVGFQGYDDYGNLRSDGKPVNTSRQGKDCRGLYFTNATLQPHMKGYGSMALTTRDSQSAVRSCWQVSSGRDSLQDFWDHFLRGLPLKPAFEEDQGAQGKRVGSLFIRHKLLPGESKNFEFFLSWCFPVRPCRWEGADQENREMVIRNYYATLYQNAWEVAEYTAFHIERLEKHSRDFSRALYGSTLPAEVIEAVSRNITPLCSNTCFRLEDGTFLAWEGCNEHAGSCFGTCTHVWNYAQTVAFLFPELERSARKNELLLETDDQGRMAYRARQIFSLQKFDGPPASDGQLGVIVRVYREWKFSGDDDFLQTVWPKTAKALDFAFTYWDSDGDMLFDTAQHNTYDIDFMGPNPLTACLFLAALKAGGEMARRVMDRARQARYEAAFKTCGIQMEKQLWNGRFYVQKEDSDNHHPYQLAAGCLSDQLLGQFMAWSAGLGDLLPKQYIDQTLKSIYQYNFQSPIRKTAHVQRTFALNDESGLLLCTWPDGGRPRFPFVYSDEVWTGVEYEVAALLLHEGMIDEGLSLVQAVQNRYDGIKRNPWDEVECGHHYARSMSSWALLITLSGFSVDMEKQTISFAPLIHKEHFECFFSTGQTWGIYHQHIDETGGTIRRLEILYGNTDIKLGTPSDTITQQ